MLDKTVEPREDNPLYETWMLYEMIKCLEKVIFEIASAQKSDRKLPTPGGVSQENVNKVVNNAQKRMKELKQKLEQKINP